MNLEDYPTPEADACYRHCVLHAGPANGLIMKIKMQDLERRLAFARATLRHVQNELMRDAQRNMLIDTAIRETNPPVVDSSEAGVTKGNGSEEKSKETPRTEEYR
jgi:hypothetical protein